MDFDIIKSLLNILNKDIKSLNDLFDLKISQSLLKKKEIIDSLIILIPELKKQYKTHYLTCLHKNSLEKQKFPAVNLLRQILKANNLKLKSNIIQKYSKVKNSYEIYYTIEPIKKNKPKIINLKPLCISTN